MDLIPVACLESLVDHRSLVRHCHRQYPKPRILILQLVEHQW